MSSSSGPSGLLSSPAASPSSSSSPSLTEQQRAQQQRLQYKQTIIDTWTTKEKMVLASAVLCMGGEQNWVSVSRVMKQYAEANVLERPRPADWFSQKNCALQYNKLQDALGSSGTPRRRGRQGEAGTGAGAAAGAQGGSETSEQRILKGLKDDRMNELLELMTEQENQMRQMEVSIDRSDPI